MRIEAKQLKRIMDNRHSSVSVFRNKTNSSASNSTDDNKTHSSQIEGYLFKRTSKGFKSWNRRWFYFRDNKLVYR